MRAGNENRDGSKCSDVILHGQAGFSRYFQALVEPGTIVADGIIRRQAGHTGSPVFDVKHIQEIRGRAEASCSNIGQLICPA